LVSVHLIEKRRDIVGPKTLLCFRLGLRSVYTEGLTALV